MKQIFSFVSRGISGGYAYIRTHKMVGVFVCVAIVAFSYLLFFSHNDSTSTRYAVTKVVRGSVSTTILGSGQVSASNQVDITSEVSGTVLYVGARAGDSISSGKSIVLLDSTDAKRTVENAELNLENAKISYEKAQREFENQSKNSDVSDEKKSYENGHDTISTVFIALPDILRNVGDIYYTPTHSPYFADSALRSSVGDVAVEYKLKYGVIFDEVKKTHETLLTSYNALSDNADYIAIASLLKDTKTILQRLSTVLSGTYNTIDYVYTRMDTPTSHIEADKTELSSYISKVNTYSTNISNALEAIEDAKSSATNAELNLKSAKLSVSQAEASLKTAQENLAHHNISASFDGLVANISVESGDKINSGKSVATVITKKKVADITLNEVDVAKVVLGQKATLAFDAIDDVIVEATVSEIDVLGTVAQGVVTYTVKIAFDSDDDRIKPGMTVSATIDVEAKDNILVVPNSAIKSEGSISYVQTVPSSAVLKGSVVSDIALVTRKEITTGLSDDTMTEIISGVQEGDFVITRAISSVGANQGSVIDTGSTKNTDQKTNNSSLFMQGGGPSGAMMIR